MVYLRQHERQQMEYPKIFDHTTESQRGCIVYKYLRQYRAAVETSQHTTAQTLRQKAVVLFDTITDQQLINSLHFYLDSIDTYRDRIAALAKHS